MRLVLASRNRHKVAEISALLDQPGLEVISAADVPGSPEVEEDGGTFEANAEKKAQTLARFTRAWALADDSGLEVDALGGEPGVHSARYAGPQAKDADNLRKLLAAMAGQENRRARFRCVLALAGPDGSCRTVSGSCEGTITPAARGTSGFGYDPVFVPEGETRTFAELPAEAKNGLSHRGRAMAEARRAWASLFQSL